MRCLDGTYEFRIRKKKGPALGKKYRPRTAKIAQLMQMGDRNDDRTSHIKCTPVNSNKYSSIRILYSSD